MVNVITKNKFKTRLLGNKQIPSKSWGFWCMRYAQTVCTRPRDEAIINYNSWKCAAAAYTAGMELLCMGTLEARLGIDQNTCTSPS